MWRGRTARWWQGNENKKWDFSSFLFFLKHCFSSHKFPKLQEIRRRGKRNLFRSHKLHEFFLSLILTNYNSQFRSKQGNEREGASSEDSELI